MTDDEAACVASRLADDPDTSSELAEGVTPGNEAFDRSEEFAADCAAETTYLPKLLDSLNKQLAPTAEARACIETAFVELTAAELTTITLGGSLPDGRTLQTVVTECGAG